MRQAPQQPKKIRKLNFFRKFFELQILMIQHNAGLTDSHPYASGPINWPFLLSGISFWTGNNTDREQIYMIGNFVDWWLCILALSVFVGVLGAEQIARRRGIQAIPDRTLMCSSGTNQQELMHQINFYRRDWSAVQYRRLLPSRMVLPLCAVLDHEPSIVPAPLSSRAPHVCPRGWRRIQLHL